jgi:hypothetical protein
MSYEFSLVSKRKPDTMNSQWTFAFELSLIFNMFCNFKTRFQSWDIGHCSLQTL